MNKLICDICGGAIVVQAGGKYGICDSCGASYTLDRMREIASGVKVSQTGTKEDVEQWKNLLNTYLSTFDWEAAEATVKKILEAVPSDEYSLDIYKKLKCWKDYVIKDGIMLEYKGTSNVIDIPYGVECLNFLFQRSCTKNDKAKIVIPDTVKRIENFAFESLMVLGIDEVFIPNSVEYISDIAFFHRFKGGKIKDPYEFRDELIKIYLPKKFISQKFRAYDCDFDCAISSAEFSSYEKQGYIVDSGSYPARAHVDYEDEDFIFYPENVTYETVKEWEKAEVGRIKREQAEEERREREQAKRRFDGLCQHCGGRFKGFFNPKCTSCGKEKDY